MLLRFLYRPRKEISDWTPVPIGKNDSVGIIRSGSSSDDKGHIEFAELEIGVENQLVLALLTIIKEPETKEHLFHIT
jgi:hypothetical protein